MGKALQDATIKPSPRRVLLWLFIAVWGSLYLVWGYLSHLGVFPANMRIDFQVPNLPLWVISTILGVMLVSFGSLVYKNIRILFLRDGTIVLTKDGLIDTTGTLRKWRNLSEGASAEGDVFLYFEYPSDFEIGFNAMEYSDASLALVRQFVDTYAPGRLSYD